MTAPTPARPLTAACVLGLAGAAAHAQPSLHVFGNPDGLPSSWVTSFSDDGRRAVGWGNTGAGFPTTFTWTLESGRVEVPNPPDMRTFGGYLSADATTIAGTGIRTDGNTAASYRRVGGGPWELIPKLSGWNSFAIFGVSRDGNTIVGAHDSGDFQLSEAAIWTPQTGTRRLIYPQFAQYSEARGVSKNGEVVVGNADLSTGGARAWTWHAENGFRQLPGAAGSQEVRANATNEDGSVVVGSLSISGPLFQAIVWRNEIPSLLPIPAGFGRSEALSVSGDGSIVLGRLYGPSSSTDTSFIWTASTGVLVLQDYLRDLGIMIPADARISLPVISTDGSTIGGSLRYSINGVARADAFVAIVPAPSTMGVLALFGLAAHRRRARMS